MSAVPTEPMIDEPMGQFLVPSWTYVQVRSNRPLLEVHRSLERHVAAIDPTVPVREAMRIDTALKDSLSEERVLRRSPPPCAVLAVMLATRPDSFGVMVQGVAARIREFGVRIALGAAPGRLDGTWSFGRRSALVWPELPPASWRRGPDAPGGRPAVRDPLIARLRGCSAAFP